MKGASIDPFSRPEPPTWLESVLSSRTVRRREGEGTASAVLIPLFFDAGDVRVTLVRRADRMRRHSGQVALPGGKKDPEDPDLLATALREALEEVQLLPESVTVFGALDDLVTITGYVVTPFVGWIQSPNALVPNENEVARIFHAPLRLFASPPTERRAETFFRAGYPVEGEFVWGATSSILQRLAADFANAFPRT